jgi:threonine dehydratase
MSLIILKQCEKVDNILVSIGSGALVSWIGAVIKASSPQIKVYGSAATNSKALAELDS